MSVKPQIHKNEKKQKGRLRAEKNKSLQTEKQIGDPQQEALKMEQVLEKPDQARPQDILAAQQRYGNQIVQRAVKNPCSDEYLMDEHGQLRDDLAQEIRSAGRSGQPLPPTLGSEIGSKLGHDFSRVQLHTSQNADRLSQKLNATAFTVGKHVFFRRGAYSPDSIRGRYILTHELAHVVQQSGGGDLNSSMTLGKPGDHFERQADRAAGEQNGAALKSGAALHAGTVQRKKLSFKDLRQLWELRSEDPVTGGSIPKREPFQTQISAPAPNLEDLQEDLPNRVEPKLVTESKKETVNPVRVIEEKPKNLPKVPPIKKPTARKRSLSAPPKISPPKKVSNETKPKIDAPKNILQDLDIDPIMPRKPSGFRPFDPTKDPDDINLAPKEPDNLKLSGKLVGTSQFRGDWKKRTGAAALGFGTMASITSLTGKGFGLGKEYMEDGKDKDTVGDFSTGLGLGASGLSMIGKGLGFTKGLGDLFGANSKKYRGSNAGKQVRKEKSTKAVLDMTSNVIGFGKGTSGMAKGISKFTGDDTSAKGAGIAGGIFGTLGGLLGGGKSLVDFIGSGLSGGKAIKSYKSSKDENIRKIAKVHAHQRTSKLAESGLGMVKGLSGITGGIGSFLSTAGFKKTGGIMGLVGSGVSLLSGLGQKTAKGFGSKDTGTAAKGLAERIKAGNPEALKYAKSLGIDPKKAFDKDPDGWDKNDIGVMSDLIKMKMGG